MILRFKNFSQKLRSILGAAKASWLNPDASSLMLGCLLSKQQLSQNAIENLVDVEFKVFSQFGDDGIIQWLIRKIPNLNHTFIEFGVANYRESNTRFLLMNNNWHGFVMDGSEKNIHEIMNSEYYWKHDLVAKKAFIDAENVNDLISESGFNAEIGLLHIDVDGNDYWIWKAISRISPSIVIVEYNCVFDRLGPVTIPYDPAFIRNNAHHSNLYFGTSIAALIHLAGIKDYAFVGCNSAGNNAYFVKNSLLSAAVREMTYEKGFVESKFRESRDINGNLTYVRGDARLPVIRGLPLVNVITGETIIAQ